MYALSYSQFDKCTSKRNGQQHVCLTHDPVSQQSADEDLLSLACPGGRGGGGRGEKEVGRLWVGWGGGEKGGRGREGILLGMCTCMCALTPILDIAAVRYEYIHTDSCGHLNLVKLPSYTYKRTHKSALCGTYLNTFLIASSDTFGASGNVTKMTLMLSLLFCEGRECAIIRSLASLT